MNKLAIFMMILGITGLAIGIFILSPYNQIGPYSYIFAEDYPFALLLCGVGIVFVLLGLWLERARQPRAS